MSGNPFLRKVSNNNTLNKPSEIAVKTTPTLILIGRLSGYLELNTKLKKYKKMEAIATIIFHLLLFAFPFIKSILWSKNGSPFSIKKLERKTIKRLKVRSVEILLLNCQRRIAAEKIGIP